MLRSKAIIWITAGTLLCVAGVALACKIKEEAPAPANQGESSTSLKAEYPVAAVPATVPVSEVRKENAEPPQADADAKQKVAQDPKAEPVKPADPLISVTPAPTPSEVPAVPTDPAAPPPPPAEVQPVPPVAPAESDKPADVKPVTTDPVPSSPSPAPASPIPAPAPFVKPSPIAKDPEPSMAILPAPPPPAAPEEKKPVEAPTPVVPPSTPTPIPSAPAPTPTPTPSPVVVPQPSGWPTPTPTEPKKPTQTVLVYQVRTKGETFEYIARELLGTNERAKEIESLNPALQKKGELAVGTLVIVPADSDKSKLPSTILPVSAKEEPEKSSVQPVPSIRGNTPPQKTVKTNLPLTGTYVCKIEDNHAIAVPGGVLQQLGKADMVLLTPGLDNCVWLTTPANAERLLKRVEHADIHDEDAIAFRKIYYARSEKVALDGSGRMIVPEELVKFGGLSKDLVLVGVDDHFELWDAARWQRYSQDKRIIKKQSTREKGGKVD